MSTKVEESCTKNRASQTHLQRDKHHCHSFFFFAYRNVSGTQQHTHTHTCHHITCTFATVIVQMLEEMGSDTREAVSRVSSLSLFFSQFIESSGMLFHDLRVDRP